MSMSCSWSCGRLQVVIDAAEHVEAPHVTWFGRGDTQVVSLPAPGAGLPVSDVLGGASEWCVHSVAVTFTASANAATRTPILRLVDGSGVPFFAAEQGFTVTANNTSLVVWAANIQPFGANNGPTIGTSMPELRLYSGLGIEIDAVNLDALDTFTDGRLFVTQYPIRPDTP